MSNVISIDVIADVKRAVSALGSVDSKLGRIEKTSKSGLPSLKGVLGANIIGKGIGLAVSGLQKFGSVIGDSVAEARESQKVGATTAQIIKATGGAANVSAGQVGDLATALSNKTGTDDEAIQSGANLLLTFKNVRNEVGAGNKVFDEATAAAVDLSAAGFGSIEGSSKMLGKALNDPIKGISALGRAGVTFSDKQKNTIKSMVETGDVLGAQKMILAEVKSQVGGVAEANATAGEKAAVMAGNLKEQFGTILLPYLDKFATFFTTTLGPAISKGLELIGPAISKVAGFIGPVIEKVRSLFEGGGGLNSYIASFKNLFNTLAPIVVQVIGTVVGVIKEALPTIMGIYQSIASIITSIASIIASVWTKIGPTVLPILKTTFTTIVSIIGGAFKIVEGLFKVISSVMEGDWKGAWDGIKTILKGAVQIVGAVIKGAAQNIGTVFKGIASNAQSIWNAIKNFITAPFKGAAALVKVTASGIKSALSSAWSAAKSLTSSAWNSIKSAVTERINGMLEKVRAIKGRVQGALSSVGSWLYSAGRNLISGFINGISGSIGAVVSKAREIASAAVSAAKGALGIHSPSRVFLEIGGYVTKGLVNGLDERATARAASVMANSLVSGFGTPALAPQIASGGFSGGAGAPVVYNITVNGALDKVGTAREIQDILAAGRSAGVRVNA